MTSKSFLPKPPEAAKVSGEQRSPLPESVPLLPTSEGTQTLDGQQAVDQHTVLRLERQLIYLQHTNQHAISPGDWWAGSPVRGSPSAPG